MKKAFIGNCSHSEGPLIDLLQDNGYFVTAIGSDSDAAYADKVGQFTSIDYRDIDKLSRFFGSNEFDSYVPASNELFLQSVVDMKMGEMFGLGSDSFLRKMIRKDWLAETFRDCITLQVLERRSITSDELSASVINDCFSHYGPFFLKMNVSAGGRGIFAVNSYFSLSEFQERFADISSEAGWVAEAAISGREFSICCILLNGKLEGFYWDREISNPDLFTIDLSFWDYSLLPSWLDGAISDLEGIFRVNSFSDGIFHVQVIESNGIPYVLDVTRRLPGDLYGIEVKTVTGFDLNSFFLKSITKDSAFDFDLGCLRSSEAWSPFFRFVCLSRSKVSSRFPSLDLLPYFSKMSPTIFPCFNSSGFKSPISAQRRIYICHFSSMPFELESLTYEFFSKASEISW